MMSKSGVLYVGFTTQLVRRGHQHKHHYYYGFTAKYRCHKLVYYEFFENFKLAMKREKQLKNWHRTWKIQLIRKMNPAFKDLWPDVAGI